MEEVERRYQCVMVAAVQTVNAVAHGLRVLNVFKPLAARKSLFSVFYVMIDHVSRSSDPPSPPLLFLAYIRFFSRLLSRTGNIKASDIAPSAESP